MSEQSNRLSMFESVSQYIYGDTKYHHVCRKRVVEFLDKLSPKDKEELTKSEKLELVINKIYKPVSIVEYCNWVSKKDTCGDYMCLVLLSTVYQLHIDVFQCGKLVTSIIPTLTQDWRSGGEGGRVVIEIAP